MSGAHTPGPWRADHSRGDIEIVGRPKWGCSRFGKKGYWTVAVLDDTITDEHPEEGRANARLIAAAPELLEALEAMLEMHGSDVEEQAARNKARAAIALAKGGAA